VSKRLFDHDPLTGVTEWFHYDESNDSFTIQTEQDVTEIVEANKRSQNAFNTGDAWGDKINARTHVASIDLNTYCELVKCFGTAKQNPAAWKRWLNDPDNRAFRARLGNV
jgi:hypothetical protein